MIEVRVGRQDQLDVLRAKAELPNVRVDQRCRLWQRRVEEDVSVRRCDEQRRKARRADVVRVAVDLERGEVGVPSVALRAGQGRIRLKRLSWCL